MQKLGQCLWTAICQCLLEIQIHLDFDLVITLLETWFTYTHTYKKKSFYKVIDSSIFNSSKIWKKKKLASISRKLNILCFIYAIKQLKKLLLY